MDESTKDQAADTTSSSATPPVMDVVRPKPITVTDNSSEDTSEAQPEETTPPAEPSPSVANTTPEVAAEEIDNNVNVPPASSTPDSDIVSEETPSDIVEPVHEPPADSPVSEVGEGEVPPTSDNPMAINKPAEPIKHKAPKVAIIVAIVIGFMLIAAVIFAYTRSHKSTSGLGSTHQNAAKATSPSSVDQASKDIDASLNKADDSKDFVVNDLADTTLGL